MFGIGGLVNTYKEVLQTLQAYGAAFSAGKRGVVGYP